VLQERAFERVGSTKTIPVDVRLITATHQDLEGLIHAGRFREDLYYRLNVISLRCPPLRQRREDIFELALRFLQRYATDAGKKLVRIEEEAIEAITSYSWPGNVRQLENAIQRAVVLAEGDSVRRCDLPPEVLACEEVPATAVARRRRRRLRTAVSILPANCGAPAALDEELAGLERERLVEAIARADGNKAAAARLLGLPRSTFFSKLRKFGLE
jgi:DNA-binding NtrC family response regulator